MLSPVGGAALHLILSDNALLDDPRKVAGLNPVPMTYVMRSLSWR
jgi:hypothetical protein